MSKKRHFGLTKWRLGKVEADYKEHKKNKKAGGSGYTDQGPAIIKAKAKRKYPCKRLKGDHYFDIVKVEQMKFMFIKDYYVEYKCVGCGKLRMDFVSKDEAAKIHGNTLDKR